MAKTLKFALSALALVNAQKPRDDAQHAYNQFLKDFGKSYDAVEKQARFLAFAENYEYIQRENAKSHSYKLGLNEFSDMSMDEFKMSKLGMMPESIWGNVPSGGVHKVSNVSLPKSVDWRSKAVTAVKNQKSRLLKDCYAFSVTAAMEGVWATTTDTLESLSEQQVLDCTGRPSRYGQMELNFDKPLCTEDSYPYYTANGSSCDMSSCIVALPVRSLKQWTIVYNARVHHADDVAAMMDAIFHQPVHMRIDVPRKAFLLYKSGVLLMTCSRSERLLHHLLVVGYGTEDGTDYWLVKNSWGHTWGEQGFAKLERVMKKGYCAIDSAEYPVMKAGAIARRHYRTYPCQSDEIWGYVPWVHHRATCLSATCACPTDVPAGTTAQPKCMMQSMSSGTWRCALVCIEASVRTGVCSGGSECVEVGNGWGICMYTVTETNLNLGVAVNSESPV